MVERLDKWGEARRKRKVESDTVLFQLKAHFFQKEQKKDKKRKKKT